MKHVNRPQKSNKPIISIYLDYVKQHSDIKCVNLLKQWEMTKINDGQGRNIIKPRSLTDLHYVIELN